MLYFSHTTMATLLELVRKNSAIEEIAKHLDALPAEARVAQALELGKKEQLRLFELAEKGPKASAEDFAPQSSAGKEVLFEGRNSMPVFSRFQKRFYRSPEGRVFGYNHQTMSPLTGPGYFELLPSARSGGELLFDYNRIPERGAPGWPPVKSNNGGFARLVFGGMNDYVRKAGEGVLIGYAFKDGKDMRTTFILAR